eukprot:UN26065
MIRKITFFKLTLIYRAPRSKRTTHKVLMSFSDSNKTSKACFYPVIPVSCIDNNKNPIIFLFLFSKINFFKVLQTFRKRILSYSNLLWGLVSAFKRY